jgi:N-acetyl-1-D-myo-inositol-2-amino-2-deoxy-alpha-D-glucopyranoside deacetylase
VTTTTDGERRLLLVHAHPDDETIGTGATMAKYAAEGAHVTLVTCTLGEEGEILVPALEHLAANRDGGLGKYRIGELDAAMSVLGVEDHRWLGGAGRWRDSGMMGEPSNDRPDSFWQADPDEAVGELVRVVREVRPQVMVSYDDNGGYGHPDHIQAHRVTMAAVAAAADPTYREELGEPWLTAKVYWTALPKSVLAEGISRLKAAGKSFFEVDSVDDLPIGTADELVTTAIDASEYLPAKLAAMRAHATQISSDGPFFALADGVGLQAFGIEYFQLAQGEIEKDASGYEGDLFAGIG